MPAIQEKDFVSISTELNRICREAGDIIMEFYKADFNVETKDDKSPVTCADIAASDHIVAELKALTPDIPVVSEEEIPENVDKSQPFWLVDPLDGTKSFIKKTGEFTVNIGLIMDKKPVLGSVYLPVKDKMYSSDGKKAYLDGLEISVRDPDTEKLTVIASKSHQTPETAAFIKKLKVGELINASSSLKFCLVAEGKADMYPRFGPTMEWDTAAAEAVLRAAGGQIVFTNGTDFAYGKESYRNPFFIAYGPANPLKPLVNDLLTKT